MPVLDELCENCDRQATHLEGGIPLCDSAQCHSTRQSRFEEKKLSFEEFEPNVEATIVGAVRVIPVTDPIVSAIPVPHEKTKALIGRTLSRCVKCGEQFEVKNGSAGMYCSRECYERKVVPVPVPEVTVSGKPIKMCSRGCGKPSHRGRCKGQQRARQAANTPVHHRMKPEIAAQACAAIVSRSVEHSVTQTRKETVTVSEQSHEMKRKVTIIIPKLQPTSQVKITEEIAQAVWKSLSKEQRYDLMDIDSLWEDYDDDARMSTISKILLVHPETWNEGA